MLTTPPPAVAVAAGHFFSSSLLLVHQNAPKLRYYGYFRRLAKLKRIEDL
jgi:hypothetical protein